jgi:thiamine-phosphate pyrophosphorylase
MLPALYIILDVGTIEARRDTMSVIEVAHAALAAGATLIQYRAKHITPAQMWSHAQPLATACATYNAHLLINDRADLARAVGAAGVHRPSSGLPLQALKDACAAGSLFGVSAHSSHDLTQAKRQGATFATISPIWETPSKPGYGPALGLEHLEMLANTHDLPLYALGGITPERARACRDAGAAGVAVMSGIVGARDPYTATEAYLNALSEA